VGADVDLLPALGEELAKDMPIEALERLEARLKSILKRTCEQPVSGEEARRIARFQQRVGFLLKYKPYAVKCSNPLGYSIFLQNAGEGFSFQRHTSHKVEVFHLLEVAPGGYVFLCDYSTWQEIYEPDAFASWLAGSPDDRYERHRYEPRPGDVVVIDELNVVHTVVGCVVEEFATVSTDMVDRLHDQNLGADVPERFDRRYAQERLAAIRYPGESRLVDPVAGWTTSPIEPTRIEGGAVRVLAEDFVSARHYTIDPLARGPHSADPGRAASVYVTGGSGELVVADASEIGSDVDPPTIPVSRGDLLTIVPGIHLQAINTGPEELAYSEHRIPPDVAFTPDAEHSA
jgi:mannose-6-phosphate isomerase-like protein (cupin superfamily)